MFALFHGLCRLWSLPSSMSDLPWGWLEKCPWERLGRAGLTHRPAPGHLPLEIWPYMGPCAKQREGDGCQKWSDNILEQNAPPSGTGRKEMGFPSLPSVGFF